MSTTAADVLSENSYAAPNAELRELRTSEATPDRLFSREGRLGVMAYNARLFAGLLVSSGYCIVCNVSSDSVPRMVVSLLCC